ncbi:hypothetical protein J2847_005112 [Azospirillum agricola]|uniref:ParB/RepB/Spo0J family partition protein n=1 Tax=Azospirillum agricola TaxID=1720247 RepID=UPI001AE53779|nr:ParB/RepB/Spo0J family partition protein [Azospirillum agricola]MBP2231793.1 hypothetical protein [Azospirillum agricola]
MSDPHAQPTAGDLAALGPSPSFGWLSLDALIVDPRYQRDASSTRSRGLIQRIATEFTWRNFQPPTVAPLDDHRYAILDGQHRVEGARVRGLPEVPCYIVTAPELREQAEAFVSVNRDRVAVGSLQLHYSRIVAADPEALRVQAACEEAGIVIARRTRAATDLAPLETMALKTITVLLRSYNDAPVVDALRLLAEAFPTIPGQITGAAIKALVHFFLWHAEAEIDWSRLVTTVADHHMPELEEAARASRALFGGKTHIAMSAAITRAYNKGMRDQTKRLPEQV